MASNKIISFYYGTYTFQSFTTIIWRVAADNITVIKIIIQSYIIVIIKVNKSRN